VTTLAARPGAAAASGLVAAAAGSAVEGGVVAGAVTEVITWTQGRERGKITDLKITLPRISVTRGEGIETVPADVRAFVHLREEKKNITSTSDLYLCISVNFPCDLLHFPLVCYIS
jgi:hypothetical protein